MINLHAKRTFRFATNCDMEFMMCEFHIYSFQFIMCTPAYIFSARYNKLYKQQYQTLTVGDSGAENKCLYRKFQVFNYSSVVYTLHCQCETKRKCGKNLIWCRHIWSSLNMWKYVKANNNKNNTTEDFSFYIFGGQNEYDSVQKKMWISCKFHMCNGFSH